MQQKFSFLRAFHNFHKIFQQTDLAVVVATIVFVIASAAIPINKIFFITATFYLLFLFYHTQSIQKTFLFAFVPLGMIVIGQMYVTTVIPFSELSATAYPEGRQFYFRFSPFFVLLLSSIVVLVAQAVKYSGKLSLRVEHLFLFVLLLPVFWYFVEKYQTRWLKISLLIVLLGIVTTFSRVGIFLTLIELLLLWKTTRNHQLKSVGKYGTLLFCCLGVGILLLSTQFNPTRCPLPLFQDKLCKSLRTELRPAYWSQGVRAFLARPLQGWGGGTFPVLSALFQEKSGQFSGFVHNEYLQAFTEYGVIGGVVFVSFAVCLGVLALKEIQRRRNRLHFCLAIGVGAVLSASLFDFGLHLIGIWLIFLIVLSCWLRERTTTEFLLPQRFKQFFQISVVAEFFVGSALTLVWSTAFLVSSVFWHLHKIDTAISIFPFAYWKVEEVLLQGNICPETRKFLLSLYQHQYQFLDMAAAAPSTAAAEKILLLKEAIKLDPLYESRRHTYLLAAYQAENWEEFEHALLEWKNVLANKHNSDLEYEEQKKILEITVNVANKNLDENFARALRLYQVVYEIYPWLFSVEPVELFTQLEKYPSARTFQFIKQLDPQYLWSYSIKIYNWEISLLHTAIEKKDFQSANLYVQHLFQLDNSKQWQVAQVIEHSISAEKSAKGSQSWVGYQQLIQTWEDHNPHHATFNYNSKLFVAQQLPER